MSLQAAAADRQHTHAFDEGNPLAERNTRRAVLLTAAMMVVEISGGWYFNSMALLADGWHMSSHALALGLSVFAYRFARRHAHDRRFAFGTWKVEVLGGYTSAILLLGVAAIMAYQSIERLMNPLPIHYEQAVAIAVVGLAVNLVCAWWLKDSHAHHAHHGHSHHDHGRQDHAHERRMQPAQGQHADHDHDHDHDHDREHAHLHQHAHGHTHHADLNLRAAYLHVVADAATSVLAIVALVAGWRWGVQWMDPAMGLLGSALIVIWAWGLLRDSGRVLLDAEMDAPVVDEIRDVIAHDVRDALITDLHVWRVGKGKYACVLAVVSDGEVSADQIRNALAVHEELVHVTVEVQPLMRARPAR
ncbi:cation diffusion facilitator family transporter [Luteimonas sp. RIT-PG2_3]